MANKTLICVVARSCPTTVLASADRIAAADGVDLVVREMRAIVSRRPSELAVVDGGSLP
jgi:hypothetical protein